MPSYLTVLATRPFRDIASAETLRRQQISIANHRWTLRISMLPGADSGDGKLDICVLPCDSRLGLVLWQSFIVRGRHIEHPDSIYLHGTRVKIFGDVPMPMQIDGDAAGTTPADIRLLGERVRFIVA